MNENLDLRNVLKTNNNLKYNHKFINRKLESL